MEESGGGKEGLGEFRESGTIPSPSGGDLGPSPSGGDQGELERGGIVTAKGTGNGLVIRLDGRVDAKSLGQALHDFVASRQGFLAGNEVTFEWVGVRPADAVIDDLYKKLAQDFSITVKASVLKEKPRRVSVDDRVLEAPPRKDKSLSLFGGAEGLTDDEDLNGASYLLDEEKDLEHLTRQGESHITQTAVWDDPDARMVYTTLRSGQRIETEHSLIVVGDVNSGAEIIAGGDIVVLGTLRGVAHAGAYDETGGGRFICALVLQPTQLRIGSIISRGNSESRKVPEIARVDDNLIVVEPYQARNALSKLRRL